MSFLFGHDDGYAPGDPNGPGARNDPNNYQNLVGNFQLDLLDQYIMGVDGTGGGKLKSATVYKPTGRVQDASGADITDLYNSYLSWQQGQRAANKGRDAYIDATNTAGPGRAATVLGEPGGSQVKTGVLG